jgi:hypothetical protein
MDSSFGNAAAAALGEITGGAARLEENAMSMPRSLLAASFAIAGPTLVFMAIAQGQFSVHLGSPGLGSSYALPLGDTPEAAAERSVVRFGRSGPLEYDLSGRGQMGLSDLSVMGDYYFKRSWGLRASGGMLLGQPRPVSSQDPLADSRVGTTSSMRRSSTSLGLDSRAAQNAAPYLGLGYTGTSPGRPWGFFADVGMVMLKPRSSVQLGTTPMAPAMSDQRMYDGGSDLIDDWRMSPLIQLGISYKF